MNLKQKLVDSFPLYSAQDISPKEIVNHGVEERKRDLKRTRRLSTRKKRQQLAPRDWRKIKKVKRGFGIHQCSISHLLLHPPVER